MTKPSDEQRAEWLRLLEAERQRRAKKVQQQAGAAGRQRERFAHQIVEMGERLLAGLDISPLLSELLGAKGNREQIDAICQRTDMSRMEAAALILQTDPATAVKLLKFHLGHLKRCLRWANRNSCVKIRCCGLRGCEAQLNRQGLVACRLQQTVDRHHLSRRSVRYCRHHWQCWIVEADAPAHHAARPTSTRSVAAPSICHHALPI